MYFKQDDIEKLLENVKIEKVVGELIPLSKSGVNYKGLCPFHDDTTPSFMVSPKKQICKCFSCNTGGNVINFYSKYRKIPYMEAVKELGEKYNIQLTEIKDENEEELEIYNIIMNDALEFYEKQMFENESREALKYLSERGLDTFQIKEFRLGYANSKWSELYDYLHSKGYEDNDLLELGLIKKSDEGNIYDAFRNRIIFPIFSTSERVIAFGGRTMEKANPIKYINSQDTPIFKKGHSIYGIERAKIIREKNYAIIMEGYMDVIRANIFDFDTAIAPLGTAFTEEQAKILKRYTSNVFLCFDNDKAGISATERASFILKSEGFKIKILELKGHKDPDEFLKIEGKEKFLEIVKNSKEIFDFLFDTYKADYNNIDEMLQKQNFINRFKEFFQNVTDDLEKEMYLQRLVEKVNIDFEILKKTLVTDNKKKKYKTKKEKEIEKKVDEEKKNKEKAVHENIENLEIEILNTIIKFPEYICLFENYKFKSQILNDVYNFYKTSILKDDRITTIKKSKNILKFIDENTSYKKAEKDEVFTKVAMNIILEDGINLAVIKDYFRKIIKETLKEKKDVKDKKIVKQFEIKLQKAKEISEIVEEFEKCKNILKW